MGETMCTRIVYLVESVRDQRVNDWNIALCFRWHRMGWVALGRRAGGGGRLSPILSLSLASLASSLILTILCVLTLALTLATFTRADDMYVYKSQYKTIILLLHSLF